ncbi:MAG: PmbA/TldA family metallopeptidase, partial [Gemmatimonadaceae bacterium]
MTPSRHDFLKTVSAVAATGAMGTRDGTVERLLQNQLSRRAPSVGDPAFRELTQTALDAARSAGATYADIRISARRSQNISTRERRLQNVSDSDTFGFGVRTLANGAWGFSASNVLTKDEVARVARNAVAMAKANSTVQLRPVVVVAAPPTPKSGWQSTTQVRPFSVSIPDKVAF